MFARWPAKQKGNCQSFFSQIILYIKLTWLQKQPAGSTEKPDAEVTLVLLVTQLLGSLVWSVS